MTMVKKGACNLYVSLDTNQFSLTFSFLLNFLFMFEMVKIQNVHMTMVWCQIKMALLEEP